MTNLTSFALKLVSVKTKLISFVVKLVSFIPTLIKFVTKLVSVVATLINVVPSLVKNVTKLIKFETKLVNVGTKLVNVVAKLVRSIRKVRKGGTPNEPWVATHAHNGWAFCYLAPAPENRTRPGRISFSKSHAASIRRPFAGFSGLWRGDLWIGLPDSPCSYLD